MHRKKAPRAQTALEYLITYGWAIAGALIIAFLLFTSGFPGINLYSPKQGKLDSFTLLDFQASAAGDLVIHIGNTVGRTIRLTGTVAVNGVSVALSPLEGSSTKLEPRENGTFIMRGALPVGNAGEEFRIDSLSINYITLDNNLAHTSHGFLNGVREQSVTDAIITLFQWRNQQEFDAGSYNSSSWSGEAVATTNNGTYTSDIRDAGANITWLNITWTRDNYNNPIPLVNQTRASWNFDSTCSATDATSNSNTLAFQPPCNQSQNTAGVFGNAVCLNGATQFLNASHSTSLDLNNMTIEFWIYRNGTSNWHHLVEKGYNNQYRLGLTGSNQVRWFVSGFGEFYSVATIPAQQWTQVVATYTNNPVTQQDNAKIYINGVLDSQLTGYGTPVTTNQSLFIGSNQLGTHFFGGCVDEIRIHNKPFNITEVQNNYVRAVTNTVFQARSCNDSNCIGETFSGPNGANSYYTSTQQLNLPVNRYIQFRANLSTQNTSYLAKLYNVTIRANLTS